MLNKKELPIHDEFMQKYFKEEKLSFIATNSIEDYTGIDYIIIATPTNYDDSINYFDTSSIENILNNLNKNSVSSLIIIKSTIPIGFMDLMIKKYKNLKLIFSPEFLREGYALQDNLYPSRIVFGTDLLNESMYQYALRYIELMKNAS